MLCIMCGGIFSTSGDKSGRCKPCKSAYGKQHYAENKAAYIARASASKKRVKAKYYELLHEYFQAHPCVDCGEDDTVVLEFDHIGDKVANISDLVRGGHSWDRIAGELAKCEVRCANCHRRATARRAGWTRWRLGREDAS